MKTMGKKLINFFNVNILTIIIIYIIMQPIIDIITSICARFINPVLTLGIFIRGLFLMLILTYSFIISNKKWRKIIAIYLIVVIIYLLIHLIKSYYVTGLSGMFYQIKTNFKIFYFDMLLISLVPIFNKIKPNDKFFIYCLFGYSFTIFITTAMGIAFNSYADGSAPGKNGLFYAANEIGTILCILMPYLFIEILNINSFVDLRNNISKNIFMIITLFCTIFSALWMGTKVPFLGLLLVLFVTFAICIINLIKQQHIKSYIYKIIGILLICLFIFLTIGCSPIGNNLGFTVNRLMNISANSSEESTSNQNTQSVILSNRNLFYKDTLSKYSNGSVLSKLFGIGYMEKIDSEINTKKLIEIDYYDILFSNGIIGFIIFVTPIIIILAYIVNLLFHRARMLFDNKIIFYTYSIFITFVIAGLAGHVFTAPAVSFYLAITMNKLISTLEE